MPDYIMRWLASRFIDDVDYLESLGIMTDEVRAKKDAQQALPTDDTNGGDERKPPNGEGNGNGSTATPTARQGRSEIRPKPAAVGADRHPAGDPGEDGRDLELGPACDQCGGMMQRTGSCYTCSCCGNNTGCG